MAIKPEKNRKYYRKCSNSFAADCMRTKNMHHNLNIQFLTFKISVLYFQVNYLQKKCWFSALQISTVSPERVREIILFKMLKKLLKFNVSLSERFLDQFKQLMIIQCNPTTLILKLAKRKVHGTYEKHSIHRLVS